MPAGCYPRDSLTSRFFNRVNKSGPVHPVCGVCWQWLGRLRGNGGYAVLDVNGVETGAHRVSWLLHFEEIPDGLDVLHACDNRECVNPLHLFLGTGHDNNMDMVSKDRHIRGERSKMAKLTDEEVAAIRQLYQKRKRGRGAYALAKKYGVTSGTIYFIVSGQTWKHLL